MKNFLIIIILLVSTLNCNSQTITAGIGSWMPWQNFNKETNSYEGIFVEVYEQALNNSGLKAKFKALPNKRRNELEWGKSIYAELGVIPEWREKFQSSSIYSIPVVKTNNIVLAKKGTIPKITSIEDLYGTKIGTNLGYVYTDGFEEAFKSGKIKRDDTSQEGTSIIIKLQLERVDAVILDKFEARYLIELLNLSWEDFEIIYSFKIKSKLRIRFHITYEKYLATINKEIQKMKNKGIVKKIINKYLKN